MSRQKEGGCRGRRVMIDRVGASGWVRSWVDGLMYS
jgi:hypothetical protein